MRERSIILDAFDSLVTAGCAAAVATVVAVEGSSYRRPGARMLIAADGRTWGGVSGGCLERDVARVGRAVIDSGVATLKRYETAVDDDWQDQPAADAAASLGCGGAIEILIQRVSAGEFSPLEALRASHRDNTVRIAATVYRVGGSVDAAVGQRFEHNDATPSSAGEVATTVRAELNAVANLSSTESRAKATPYRHLFAGGWIDVLYERYLPPQALIIFGDGPDVSPVVELGRMLGWRVTVVGGRPETALRERFPDADEVVYWSANGNHVRNAIDNLPFESAAVVVMQHHLARDAAALRQVGRRAVSYLGLLGPRHRTRRILDALSLAEAAVIELHSPIGLDIGAEGPEQIALAVVAEIQATLAGKSAEPLTAVAHRDWEPAK